MDQLSTWPYNLIATLLGFVFISLSMYLMPDVKTRWGLYAFVIGLYLIESGRVDQ